MFYLNVQFRYKNRTRNNMNRKYRKIGIFFHLHFSWFDQFVFAGNPSKTF